MAESELTKELVESIKRADKLVGDLKRDVTSLLDAIRKLKEILRGRGSDEEESETR